MTKLDIVCSVLEDIAVDDGDASKLLDAIQAFENSDRPTYAGLRRVPAFAKLWDALSNMASANMRIEED